MRYFLNTFQSVDFYAFRIHTMSSVGKLFASLKTLHIDYY